MVRPDDEAQLPLGEVSPSCCNEPAGVSPVPVGAGAPGSRSQAGGETLLARAGRRKPLRREQPRGPQHQVNAAASTDSQREGRAAHFTAKATSARQNPDRLVGLPGVGAVAREDGSLWNRRGPSQRPGSRHGVSYKPRAKSSAAERESEGAIVVRIPVQQNTGGAKDPHFGHAGLNGTDEGMVGSRIRPNNPVGPRLDVKVRYLREGLRARAKRAEVPHRVRIQTPRADLRVDRTAVRDGQPVHASPRGPSVSRVRENRTHGLKGGSASSPNRRGG